MMGLPPIAIALITWVLVVAGGLLGMWIGPRLPDALFIRQPRTDPHPGAIRNR